MSTSATEIDLRPQKVKIKVRTGDAWSLRVRVSVSGVPTDLTDYAIAATAGGAPLDVTSRDDANGIFFFGQAAAVASGALDVKLTTAGGATRTYIGGAVVLDTSA